MRIDLCCEPGLMRIDLVDLLAELLPDGVVAEHDGASEISLHTLGLRPDLVVLHRGLAAAAGLPDLAALREAGTPVVAIGSRDEMSLAVARGWIGVPVPFTDEDIVAAIDHALGEGVGAPDGAGPRAPTPSPPARARRPGRG